MERKYTVGLFSLLLMAILVIGGAAGCSSSPATTTTTTSPTPGGAGGGALVINDSIVSVRIESISPRGDGITDLSVTVISTENVGDKVNPVADKVGLQINVWTDEDVSGFKAGDTVNGRIMYAGDAVIGITYRLYDIARK
jgi:hypothetical protein